MGEDDKCLQAKCKEQLKKLLGPPTSKNGHLTKSGQKAVEILAESELLTLSKYLQIWNALKEEKNKAEENEPSESTSNASSPQGLSCSDIFGRSKDKPTVRIYKRENVTTTCQADKKILNRVMDLHSIELTEVNSWEHCDVVLLFCVVLTRPGSDVEEAMMSIPDAAKGRKPVILVLMHHTRDEDHITDIMQWNSIYPEVKFQADILFHETKRDGLLVCEKNKQAFEELSDYIKMQLDS